MSKGCLGKPGANYDIPRRRPVERYVLQYKEERCTQSQDICCVLFRYGSLYTLLKSKQPLGMEGASQTDAIPWIDFNNLRVAIILWHTCRWQWGGGRKPIATASYIQRFISLAATRWLLFKCVSLISNLIVWTIMRITRSNCGRRHA